MKLKKFIKPFKVYNEDYTEVELYNEVTNQTLYFGDISYIPKQLLKYKVDPYATAFIKVQGDGTNIHPTIVIPILKNC